MTIRKEIDKNGHIRFVLDHKVGGKRKRTYCVTIQEAKARARLLEDGIKTSGSEFMSFSPTARAELILAQQRAIEVGFNLLDAVNFYASYFIKKPSAETLDEAVEIFLKQRKSELERVSYKNLKSVVSRWRDAMKVKLVVELDKQMIKDWIMGLTVRGSRKPLRARTRNGYLAEVVNFLNWAKENNIVTENVADQLPQFKPTSAELKEKEDEAHILTPREVRKIMDWVVSNRPDMTPRVAALFFAGLRPDREAHRFDWAHVDFEENLLFVPASSAKDRQRRYIEMHPTLVAWLKWAREYSTPVINWDNGWALARKQVKAWPHDGARHCYASYSLPIIGKENVIENLGHGDYEMLFKHYRTVVKRKDADNYWANLPPES